VLDERAERVARNESRFREINEGLRADLERLPVAPEMIPFVCECGSTSCTGMVEVTLAEYEAVRANSRHFVVLPGHEIPDTEAVIELTDRFAVVEKNPEAAPIVDSTDPRHPPA
jgi:hypothetical protein